MTPADALPRSPSTRRRQSLAPTLAVAAAVATVVITGAGPASAAPSSPPTGQPVAAGADQSEPGPHFYSGSDVTISGTVDGDVYAAGQKVTISGDVTGDVIAAAQTINLTGTVDGSVRLAAQDITIDGPVTRSGTLASSSITITDRGSFGTDVVGGASTVDVAGGIGRNLQLNVDRLTIDGTVGGDVGYTSDRTARIATGSVDGTIDRVQATPDTRADVSPVAAITSWLLGLLYSVIALSLATLALVLLLPRWLRQVTDELASRPWRALLVGFLAGIVVPGVLLALLATIVGAPLAGAAFLVWAVLLLATFPIGAYHLGRLLFRGIRRPLAAALLGGLVLVIALHVPWLNVVVVAAVLLFGLGAQLLAFSEHRPWRAAPRNGADTIGEPTRTVGSTTPVSVVGAS